MVTGSKRILVALSAAIALQYVAIGEAPMPKNTILPSSDAPDFVKRQWKDAVDNGQFPLPKRDWTEVGLPPGLEEQVWKAWAPGAKRIWRNISPGYANVTYDAKVDGGVISLLLDGGGIVQSKDGGRTWNPISHHLGNFAAAYCRYSFDISPANPEIIAVTGARIDRSLNGGRSWSPVYDPALPPFAARRKIAFGAIRFNADGSKVFAAPGAFGHGFGPRKGVEPEMAAWLKRKMLYVGDGQVANFKAFDLGPFAGIRCVLPHFSDPDLVYLSYSDGSVFVCRNAKAANPVFTQLALPDAMNGFQAVCLDVSPENPETLLMTLIERSDAQNHSGGGKSKIVLAKLSGEKLSCEIVDVGPQNGFGSAKWNPRNPKQVFVGMRWGKEPIRISDDGMKSFRGLPFPKELYYAEPGAPDKTFANYSSPHKFEFDRKSDLAITRSVTGAWSSRDGFRTMEDLLMTYDPVRNLYGNKGSGFAECGISIAIRKNNTYIATNDHGAWRSDGADTSKWRRISSNPGMPTGPGGEAFRGLSFPIGVSADEAYVYLVAKVGYLYADSKAWMDKNGTKGKPAPYSNSYLKLMLSRDKGDTWTDVTDRLGQGEFLEDEGGGGQRIFFDPTDSMKQWIVMSGRIFISTDGGATFNTSKLRDSMIFRSIDYDPVRKTLYAATRQSLMKSVDFGMTWSKLPYDMVPYAVGVLANGDLMVSDDGRLMVIPRDKIDGGVIEQSMIRMSIGGSVPEAACGQRTFRPIVCDGMNILTLTSDGWNMSDSSRDLGPLLSRDGGRTFQWIVYDLPCQEGLGADMRDGRIILGNRGIYELDLNTLKLK
jgi:hypothetical protein